MTTSGIAQTSASDSVGYHSQYLSGWCQQCGRKRGADGRCADCDGWWTSPLLRVGGPVIAVGTVLMVGLIPLLQHRTYTPVYAVAPVLSSPAAPFTSRPLIISPAAPIAPASYLPTTAPFSAPAPVFVPAAPPPTPMNPADDWERVRRVSRSADTALRAFEQQRDAAEWRERHRAAVQEGFTSTAVAPSLLFPPTAAPSATTADTGARND